MSGTFPSTPAPSGAKISSSKQTAISFAENSRRQARNIYGHLWEMDLLFESMSRIEFAPIMGFSAKQKGMSGSFQIVLQHLADPLGIATGTPLCDAGDAAGSDTVSSKGWTPSITGIFKAGSFLRFTNHSKVYMLTEDVDSDGSGNCELPIFPPTYESVINDEAIVISDVEFTMSFANDVQEFNTSVPDIYRFKAKLMESIA